jgi:hypothetical protein
VACNSKAKLLDDIEYEGFDYALVGYDDYSGVPDPIFQELYQAYLVARTQLKDHLGLKD